MTDVLVPATKLDAVNLMLASIGQTPLNSLDTTGIRDAAIAELDLDMVTRSVLTRGWSFNTDYEFEIAPDVSDNILIPSNALSIVPTYDYNDFVERDNSGTRMMYDREENSFEITTTEEYTIIRAVNLIQTPEAFRLYIMTRAARLFQSHIIGSDILFRYTAQHENEALATLTKAERRAKKTNIFRKDTGPNVAIHRMRNPV